MNRNLESASEPDFAICAEGKEFIHACRRLAVTIDRARRTAGFAQPREIPIVLRQMKNVPPFVVNAPQPEKVRNPFYLK
jgi:hypothetical protein